MGFKEDTMAEIQPFRAYRYDLGRVGALQDVVAPPYDVSDMTAQLACRAVMDVLGTLVAEGKLGRREPVAAEEPTSPDLA